MSAKPTHKIPTMGWWALGLISFLVPYLLAGGGRQLQRRLDQAKVERAISALVAEHWEELVEGAATVGSSPGPVVLIEFADYECQFCRILSPTLDSVSAATGVAVIYRHLPIRHLHPMAESAARAAVCAQSQGRFAEMHHALMTTSEWRKTGALTELAFSVQVADTLVFNRCLNAPETSERLAEDERLARLLYVAGTPTLFSREGIFKEEPSLDRVAALPRANPE